MAAIPVYIIGTITLKDGIEQCVVSGLASIEGLGVGGGPIVPPQEPPSIWPSPGHPAHPIAPGGPPPSVWPSPGHPAHPIAPGGPPPQVEHPIVLPPVEPGGPPVTIWPGGKPEHPIVLPPAPPIDPGIPGGGKPPPADGGWGYHPVFGWGYFPAPGEPSPKK